MIQKDQAVVRKLISKSSRHFALALFFSSFRQVSCSISDLRYFMSADSSLKARMVAQLSTIILSSRECTTGSPSSRNRSSTMGASSMGQLYRQIVTQYCANMPKSHYNCSINRNTLGTCSCMSCLRMPNMRCSPERSFSNNSAHPFQRITPTNTQNTLSASSSSMMAWPLSSWSFYMDSSRSSTPPIRFMPCVYPLPLSFAQAISILRSSGRCGVMASVRRTSLSIVSSSDEDRPAGSARSSKDMDAPLRISFVFASTSHTSLRMRQSMPLKTEKQRSFLECPERSLLLITASHY